MEVSAFGRLLLPDYYLTGTSFQILRTFRICFSHSFFSILANSAKNLAEACRKIGEKQRTTRPSCFANGKVVGGINPKKAGTEHLGLPVFANCTEAKKATGCNATVLGFDPPWQRGGVPGDTKIQSNVESTTEEISFFICEMRRGYLRPAPRGRLRSDGGTACCALPVDGTKDTKLLDTFW